ncbi:hypothetical protein PN480_07295 [Dolichospermum circinale CS-1225]|uniref:Transposase n=1 Tax=Dolichospermum circinale CS-537/01 TaxID=3021739 RepID=A0ABT5A5L6_9CYAN|nr:hypothetical protein [Dolichospermum circinale]MDB9467343.1 hypothetical protein [Dolichospermum circinale CS-539/09]MDB9470527.1 hypothetical protein [Dolichospermum circinale CS-539]MDB9487214.1 hypothetical protein [Dolichospermum circinale CS-537/01]MDB9521757.1 hypothetical protein [Dolichospermum circinale CS-1225]
MNEVTRTGNSLLKLKVARNWGIGRNSDSVDHPQSPDSILVANSQIAKA